MFHLPSWGEEIARGRRIRRAVPDSRSYSSPLLLSPSLGCYHPKLIADSRNRPLLPHSGRRRLKSTVIGRFRVVMGWKQPQSAIVYRSWFRSPPLLLLEGPPEFSHVTITAMDLFADLRDEQQFFIDHPGAAPISTAQVNLLTC
ncbi:hypothetical protein GW17_00023193 [Ensete ventricosum]|nr:hypothetical protein GW17_00023193 [Ensete ventricosum]